jgi:Mce-associated membrane protein
VLTSQRGSAPREGATDALDLAREAEAEAEAALAAAEQARARAELLRRQAELDVRSQDDADEPEADSSDADSPDADSSDADGADPPGPRRRRALGLVTGAVAAVLTVALLSASGYMIWHHQQAQQRHEQEAEYAAAARQVVFTLMSIDAEKAEDNVAQILDSSTGQFHTEFEGAAQDFIQLAKDGQVVTDVSVKAAAVESMTDDSAVVMVTAASTVSNAAGADTQPRQWRLRVDMVRDEGQLKMSKMEFVL